MCLWNLRHLNSFKKNTGKYSQKHKQQELRKALKWFDSNFLDQREAPILNIYNMSAGQSESRNGRLRMDLHGHFLSFAGRTLRCSQVCQVSGLNLVPVGQTAPQIRQPGGNWSRYLTSSAEVPFSQAIELPGFENSNPQPWSGSDFLI